MLGARYEDEDEAGINAPTTDEVAQFTFLMVQRDLGEARIPLNGAKPKQVICIGCGKKISARRVEIYLKEGYVPKRCCACQERKEQENHYRRQLANRRQNFIG